VWFNHQPIIAGTPGLPPQPARAMMGPGGPPPSMRNYATKDDRWLSLVFVNDPDDWWADLCTILGRPEMAEGAFATSVGRAEHAHELSTWLRETFASMTLDEAKRLLAPAMGAWAPVQTPAEMHQDP